MDKPRNTGNTLIEDAESAIIEGGSAGGTKATNIGSRSDAERLNDPEGRERASKQDDIDQDDAAAQARARAS